MSQQNEITGVPDIKSPFKVPFDIYSYKDILPSLRDYLEHDEILNQDHYDKGRVEKMIWTPDDPTPDMIASPTWIEQETRRIIVTGVWIFIKGYPVWIPPNYYFQLKYGTAGDGHPQFRLKRLKHKYFKIRARKNPHIKGTFTVKNRQDGETTDCMHDSLWECNEGLMKGGLMQIGLQSKTRDDAKNPCWLTVKSIWNGLPFWVKDKIYSDFTSGDKIAEKLEFQSHADGDKKGRNVLFTFYASVYNAMDGKNNMRKCILDEILKWIECDLAATIECYSKFIMPGFRRNGLFDMFSSPPAFDCKSYRDGYSIWEDSDPTQLMPNGATKSRIMRYRSDPLEGIEGAYDLYGDADANEIYDFIMNERKNTSKDKLSQAIRDYALTEAEMWGTLDAGTAWSNRKGLVERKTYLIKARFKDSKTQEPARVYGNLEWRDGALDTDVDFRQANMDHFDLDVARFCFAYLPQVQDPLQYTGGNNSRPLPPTYVENVIGLDPFNHRFNVDQKPSDQAMVNRKFRDVLKTGIINVPTMIYCCRPNHQEIAFEDALKAGVYNRALIQYENRSDKFENYAQDRGYWNWLLPPIGESAESKRRGDAPTGKGTFLDEGIGLLDAATNVPLHEGGTYWLDNYWFLELLDDYLKFNRKNTQAANLTMADFQALIGMVKIMHKLKKKQMPSEFVDEVFNYVFS